MYAEAKASGDVAEAQRIRGLLTEFDTFAEQRIRQALTDAAAVQGTPTPPLDPSIDQPKLLEAVKEQRDLFQQRFMEWSSTADMTDENKATLEAFGTINHSWFTALESIERGDDPLPLLDGELGIYLRPPVDANRAEAATMVRNILAGFMADPDLHHAVDPNTGLIQAANGPRPGPAPQGPVATADNFAAHHGVRGQSTPPSALEIEANLEQFEALGIAPQNIVLDARQFDSPEGALKVMDELTEFSRAVELEDGTELSIVVRGPQEPTRVAVEKRPLVVVESEDGGFAVFSGSGKGMTDSKGPGGGRQWRPAAGGDPIDARPRLPTPDELAEAQALEDAGQLENARLATGWSDGNRPPPGSYENVPIYDRLRDPVRTTGDGPESGEDSFYSQLGYRPDDELYRNVPTYETIPLVTYRNVDASGRPVMVSKPDEPGEWAKVEKAFFYDSVRQGPTQSGVGVTVQPSREGAFQNPVQMETVTFEIVPRDDGGKVSIVMGPTASNDVAAGLDTVVVIDARTGEVADPDTYVIIPKWDKHQTAAEADELFQARGGESHQGLTRQEWEEALAGMRERRARWAQEAQQAQQAAQTGFGQTVRQNKLAKFFGANPPAGTVSAEDVKVLNNMPHVNFDDGTAFARERRRKLPAPGYYDLEEAMLKYDWHKFLSQTAEWEASRNVDSGPVFHISPEEFVTLDLPDFSEVEDVQEIRQTRLRTASGEFGSTETLVENPDTLAEAAPDLLVRTSTAELPGGATLEGGDELTIVIRGGEEPPRVVVEDPPPVAVEGEDGIAVFSGSGRGMTDGTGGGTDSGHRRAVWKRNHWGNPKDRGSRILGRGEQRLTLRDITPVKGPGKRAKRSNGWRKRVGALFRRLRRKQVQPLEPLNIVGPASMRVEAVVHVESAPTRQADIVDIAGAETASLAGLDAYTPFFVSRAFNKGGDAAVLDEARDFHKNTLAWTEVHNKANWKTADEQYKKLRKLIGDYLQKKHLHEAGLIGTKPTPPQLDDVTRQTDNLATGPALVGPQPLTQVEPPPPPESVPESIPRGIRGARSDLEKALRAKIKKVKRDQRRAWDPFQKRIHGQHLAFLEEQLQAVEDTSTSTEDLVVNLWTWPWPGRSTPTVEMPETPPPGGYYHERGAGEFCGQISMNTYFGGPTVSPDTWNDFLRESRFSALADPQGGPEWIAKNGMDYIQIPIMNRILAEKGLIDPSLADMRVEKIPRLAKVADPGNAEDAALAAKLNDYPGDRIIVGVLPGHYTTLRRDGTGSWTLIDDQLSEQEKFADLATFVRSRENAAKNGRLVFMHPRADYPLGELLMSNDLMDQTNALFQAPEGTGTGT